MKGFYHICLPKRNRSSTGLAACPGSYLSSYLQYICTLNNDHYNASPTLCMLLSPQPLNAGVRSISGSVCTTNFRKLWTPSPVTPGKWQQQWGSGGFLLGVPQPGSEPSAPRGPRSGAAAQASLRCQSQQLSATPKMPIYNFSSSWKPKEMTTKPC